jgi:hypothetical protein
MALTEEEFEKIVHQVCERVLTRQVEVIGNLMQNHADIHKITKNFYVDYPEFKTDPLSVRSVVREFEEKNPGVVYDKLLKMAVPEIKNRIKTVASLDIENVPRRKELDLNIDLGNNGEL